MPPPRSAADAPSGWLALALDTGTAELGSLSDAALVEAIVGFDRVASWAAARQARLLAELARRRSRDPVPDADRASVASTFAPDGWTVTAHPDGTLTWTTPTGYRHTTTPHDYRPDQPPVPTPVPIAPAPAVPEPGTASAGCDPPPF